MHSLDPAAGLELFQSGKMPESEQEWDRLVPPQALEALGKKEVERQSVLFEVFKSELDYVNDLQTVEDVYITPILSAPHEIIAEERGKIFVSEVFWNLNEILAHHKRMLRSLFARQRDQHPLIQSVADIILDNALQFTPEYESYIKHSPLSLEHHRKELDQNLLYKDFIERCFEDPRLRKRDFKTLLSRPITRLPRLKLVLERIENLTFEGHPDLETIPIVLTVLQDFIKSSEPGIAAAEDKVKFGALHKSLVDLQGEITDLDLQDESRTLVRSGPLARQKSDTFRSWSDVFGALLDNYFLLLKEQMSASGMIMRSHIVRPIPLEYLQLVSFDEPPEVRKARADNGSFISISSTKQNMYPFTIYHANTSIPRRYTLYTPTPTARTNWHNALVDAIGLRKARQDANKWYGPQMLNDGFFRLPSRSSLTAAGMHFTGRILCAAHFPFHKRNYLAAGCTNGIYVGIRADSSFQKVLELISPTSIVAVPESNKFLVHCDTALFSYPLDLVVRVSQGHVTPKTLGNSVERLAQKDGSVSFFKAGRVGHRTLIVYAAKSFLHATLHVLELTHRDENTMSSANRGSSYQPFGSPMPIPRDAHDAIFLGQKVAICASKAIHIVKPTNMTVSPTVVPNLFDSTRDANTSVHVLREKCNASKILGLIRYERNEILVVYDEFGCYIDNHGIPVRSAGYISWECRATAYAHRGAHLLLFSPKFIEVRSIASGKLVQVIEGEDVRLVHSGLTEEDMLVAAMKGDIEDEKGLSEKVLELVPTAAIDAQELVGRVEQYWDEWDV
ncbi:hypothetical protein F5888DRAFT_1898003 [Russula emetica]|nr:hypothetical protein F5888DRAFT_1898003 [Russula emetica]